MVSRSLALLFSSQTIKDCELKPQMLRPLEENMNSTLQDVGVRKEFMKWPPLGRN